MNVDISITGDYAYLTAPYSSDLPHQAKALGGRWDPSKRAWRFIATREAAVRELAHKVYGTDGTVTPTMVTVRVAANVCDVDDNWRPKELRLCGRTIARVVDRDSGARLDETAAVVEGKLWSGGSRKNPSINWDDGTVIEIVNVPEKLAEQAVADRAGVEIVRQQAENVEALLEERERLAVRIAEIDDFLANYGRT